MDRFSIESIKETALEFAYSQDFLEAVISSTNAFLENDYGYSVEIFPEGGWRVDWTNNFGNLYDTPGAIFSVPALAWEDDTDDPEEIFIDNCLENFLDGVDDWYNKTMDYFEAGC